LIALSSSLSVPDSFKSVGTTDPSTLKKAIFWAHGTADYVPINCQLPEFSLINIYCLLLIFSRVGATQSIDYLVNPVGFKKISKNEAPTAGTITWSSYEGLKHETNEEELEDIQKW
jgi:lysophospholipase-1